MGDVLKEKGRRQSADASVGPSVLAIGAHPDDIEFMMAGTLILLKDAGWEAHYMNIANGSCGTQSEDAAQIAARRRQEALDACRVIGAHYHESLTNDLEIYPTRELVAKVVATIRRVRPRILLLLSPTDYMEDHTNACRIWVTAAFARGMRNAPCDPPVPPIPEEAAIYHALPTGLRDPLRKRVRAGQYVDITPVMKTKRQMLAAHRSQKAWLDVSQGINAYLDVMEALSQETGKMSGAFEYAEGWRRHYHLGFSVADQDPLCEALGERCIVDRQYEESLEGF
jgi:LmbE family N-acetylglucosaminyl deacetylase